MARNLSLPLITPDEVRAAAKSFPTETGLAADNISPRALLRLSSEALEALAALLNKIEAVGTWTPALDPVLVVLLSKPDGGFRPIGLFPTLVRVWMRVRTPVARRWEQDNADGCMYGAAGMGAQRAAWLEACCS